MNPTEKAKELFNLFFPLVEAHSSEGQIENAKECATYCCLSILDALEDNEWQNKNQIDYYNKVESEIEKL